MITKNAGHTQKLAAGVAKKILKNPFKYAAIIGLVGELGSGKTTFAKGFAKGLGVKQIVRSPTFIIARRHILKTKIRKNFYHIDVYRVGPKDLLMLGWREWIKNPQNIILVEWADRILKIMPKNSIIIKFEILKNDQRKITIQ